MEYLDPLKQLGLKSPSELLQAKKEEPAVRSVPHITADTLACPACEAGGCMTGLQKKTVEERAS